MCARGLVSSYPKMVFVNKSKIGRALRRAEA